MARYALNANGSQGWLDIDIAQDTCTGQMQFDFAPDGQAVNKNAAIANGTVDRTVPQSVVVNFDRGNRRQHYRGWLSEDGRVIAGYFTAGRDGYQLGWYATRYV